MNGPLLLLVCVIFTTAASYSLKLAALAEPGRGGLVALATNPLTIIGALCYVATFAVYAIALQKVPLSLAQPVITGGASVVTALLSVLLLKEFMGIINWIGLMLVCVGVYLMFVGRV